jgi:O-antigen ligase
LRTIAFWLSLVLIFSIPAEAVVEYPVLGSASRVIGIALATFWIGTVVVTGRFRKLTPFHIALLVFICWNALSIFWSANADRTVEHILTWIQLFLMIFILWDLYTTRETILAGLQMYVLGCYIALGSTIINFLIGNTFYYERYSAAGTSPDDLGAILAIGIPMAWYLANSKRNSKFSYLLKVVNYAYIPAALMGISLSATRLALVATIPGIVFGLASLTQVKLSTRITIFLFLIVAAYYLLPLIPQESFQRLGTTGTEISSGDLNGRVELWRQGIVAFEEHPLLGVGSNMYRSVNTENKVAHNSFISVLVELGLVGIVLFGITLAIAIRQIFGQPTWDTRLWLAVLAGWAVAASTLTWEYRKPTWLFLSLIIANAALIRHGEEIIEPVRNNTSEAQVTQ